MANVLLLTLLLVRGFEILWDGDCCCCEKEDYSNVSITIHTFEKHCWALAAFRVRRCPVPVIAVYYCDAPQFSRLTLPCSFDPPSVSHVRSYPGVLVPET